MLLVQLLESQEILRHAIESIPAHRMRTRSAAGGFAIVEHAWHLADLEEEGFAVRIRRIMAESNPQLPDFKGDVIARERRYIELAMAPALDRYAAVREANVERLRGAEHWSRPAVQEHVGPVTLESVACSILQHDIAHANEIAGLTRELGLVVPAALVSLASLEPLARSA